MSENSVGFSGVAAVLGRAHLSLADLHARGQLVSSPEALAELGFQSAYLATDTEDAGSLALAAAKAAMEDARGAPDEIDVLIWASALSDNHHRAIPETDRTPVEELLRKFNYGASWLQDALGLDRASVIGNAQQGCSGMFSALRTARALLLAEPNLRHVLCVGVDVLPPDAPREILYNLISDAAAAVVVSRPVATDRWLGYRQVSKGYYWNIPEKRNEIIASYFPTSRIVISQLLELTGLSPADIDLVIPTGVSGETWTVLAQLVGIAPEKIYRSEREFGHTIAADNFLHLADIRRAGLVPRGGRLLLFTYGFGSSWCGLILEH